MCLSSTQPVSTVTSAGAGRCLAREVVKGVGSADQGVRPVQDMAGRVRQKLCHLNPTDWGDHTGAVDVCHICGKWTCEGHLGKVDLIQSTDEYQHFCPRCLEDTSEWRIAEYLDRD